MIGMNVNASSFKNLVSNWTNEIGENLWKKTYTENVTPLTSQYTQNMLAYDASQRDVRTNYMDAAEQAYDTYVANQRASAFSNYGTGDRAAINQTYAKAYEEARKQYRENYESAIADINEKRNELSLNYAQTVKTFADAINAEQESIAQNYADFFNSYYDYLSSVYEQYGSDAVIFGGSSPLSQYVKNGHLLERDELMNLISTTDETGTHLNDEALKYIQAVGGLSEYVKPLSEQSGYSDVISFQEYLYKNSPDIEKFRSEYGEQFYKDIGFKNGSIDAYDTSVYKSDDTRLEQTVNVKSGNKVNVTVEGNLFKLKRDTADVTDNVVKLLNKQTTGKIDTNPSDNTVTVIDDKAYVYDGTNWRELKDRDNGDSVANFITWYEGNRTGVMDTQVVAKGSDLFAVGNGYVHMSGGQSTTRPWQNTPGVEYETTDKIESTVTDYLDSQRGQNDKEIIKYNNNYYIKFNNKWWLIHDYEQSK